MEGVDLLNILYFRNVCLYVLVYVGFFRFEEVFNIRMNYIYFYEECMIIKVEKSKID